ncbi:Protein of unknown function [Bacillus cereus]|nr:Protein of unknown function [Bacillus cereus]SCN35855.1 Protein of unknown function [Bacillus wiedmannii]
MERNTVNEYTI